MFDPELYLSEYVYHDLKTGAERISTCRYRDSTECTEDMINFNSPNVKHDQRFPYFCTTIPGLISVFVFYNSIILFNMIPCVFPGESEWVKEAFRKEAPQVCFPTGSRSRQEKRERFEIKVTSDSTDQKCSLLFREDSDGEEEMEVEGQNGEGSDLHKRPRQEEADSAPQPTVVESFVDTRKGVDEDFAQILRAWSLKGFIFSSIGDCQSIRGPRQRQ